MSLDPTIRKNVDLKEVKDEQPESQTEQSRDVISPAPVIKSVVRSSKFRHIEGKSKHSSTCITKIPSLCSTVPGDSNAFQVSI